MQSHDWILEVCEDLVAYAKKHELHHLECTLGRAVASVKHDLLLATINADHDKGGTFAIIGTAMNVPKEKETSENRVRAHTPRYWS